MENLTLYVILAAVFRWNEWSRHRKFHFRLQWTFCGSGKRCTFTFSGVVFFFCIVWYFTGGWVVWGAAFIHLFDCTIKHQMNGSHRSQCVLFNDFVVLVKGHIVKAKCFIDEKYQYHCLKKSKWCSPPSISASLLAFDTQRNYILLFLWLLITFHK